MDMLPARGEGNEMGNIRAIFFSAVLAIAPVRIQEPAATPGYSVKVEFENE